MNLFVQRTINFSHIVTIFIIQIIEEVCVGVTYGKGKDYYF